MKQMPPRGFARGLTLLIVWAAFSHASCSSSDDKKTDPEPKKCASPNVDCNVACANLATMCAPQPQSWCKITCQYLTIGSGCVNSCVEWRQFTSSWHCNEQETTCEGFEKCANACPD